MEDTDNMTIDEIVKKLREKGRELEAYKNGVEKCQYHCFMSDGVHINFIDRCFHPKRENWRN